MIITKLFTIYLSISFNSPSNFVLPDLTCKPLCEMFQLSSLNADLQEFIKKAALTVSKNASNCQEIYAKSRELLTSLFNNSMDFLNQTTVRDPEVVKSNTGIPKNITFNTDFFQSLNVLVSKTSRLKMEECLKAKGTYHSQTGVCITEENAGQDEESLKTMEIMNIIGNSTSILTLILLLVIIIIFRELQTIPGKYMAHITVILLIGQTLLLLSQVGKKNTTACAFIGIFIHWTYLTIFSLMCVIAVSTNRTFCHPMVVSQIEKARRYSLAMKAAYGFPLTIMTPCIITQLINPSKINYGNNRRCFITNVWANLFAFVIPIGFILILNCVCLTAAVYRIHRANKENTRILRHRSSHMHRIQTLVLIIKLGTFTGLGWIFGFIGSVTSVTVFNWIFEVLCSFQGFGIFCGFLCSVRVYNIFMTKMHSSKRKLTKPNSDKPFADSKTTRMWMAI